MPNYESPVQLTETVPGFFRDEYYVYSRETGSERVHFKLGRVRFSALLDDKAFI